MKKPYDKTKKQNKHWARRERDARRSPIKKANRIKRAEDLRQIR